MQGFSFIVLCAIFALVSATLGAEVKIDPSIVHRVKRSPSNANITKLGGNEKGNLTTVIAVAESKIIKIETPTLAANETKKLIKEDETSKKPETLSALKKPKTLRLVRHSDQKQNASLTSAENVTLSFLKDLHKSHSGHVSARTLRRHLKRSTNKEHEIENGNRFFLLNTEDTAAEIFHRPRNAFGSYANREKFIDFLTNETPANSNATTNPVSKRQAGEQHAHHEPPATIHLGKSFIIKGMASNPRPKFKRSHIPAIGLDEDNLFRHGRAHKNEHESNHLSYAVDGSSSNNNSPMHNFEQFAKLIMNLNEGEKQGHAQVNDESISPVSKYTEIIFKPIGLDIAAAAASNDVSLVGLNDYNTNEFGSSMPQEQHSIAGAAVVYESPLTIVSNAFPFNLLASGGGETALASKKDDNPNDEYEMTCPVHFKRSLNSNTKDGVIEMCSCHLFKKKRLV